jgi:hypothetical protein
MFNFVDGELVEQKGNTSIFYNMIHSTIEASTLRFLFQNSFCVNNLFSKYSCNSLAQTYVCFFLSLGFRQKQSEVEQAFVSLKANFSILVHMFCFLQNFEEAGFFNQNAFFSLANRNGLFSCSIKLFWWDCYEEKIGFFVLHHVNCSHSWKLHQKINKTIDNFLKFQKTVSDFPETNHCS